MANCFLCHKGAVKGFKVSHSSIKTKRLFKPNLHTLKCQFEGKYNKIVRMCSKCYKKIQKEFWEGKRLPLIPVSLLNQKKYKKTLIQKKVNG